ncbi:MAG: galactokinase [Deltaproteobacteria bacterium]|nr:galactokinase [Deltaproteobacteria bacterium]
MIKSANPVIKASAPCRVDLGGTLDIKIFHNLFKNKRVATFNIALNLRTEVTIEPYSEDKIKVSSKGFEPIEFFYDKVRYDGPLGIIFLTAKHFNIKGIHIKIDSTSPPKSGLGGSSSATVALIYGFSKLKSYNLSVYDTVLLAYKLEEKALKSLCGMQDHLAAGYGGVNLWEWNKNKIASPFIRKEIITDKNSLKNRIIAAYCGVEHNSKIINSKLIKDFSEKKYVDIWRKIADITPEFAESIEKGDIETAAALMNLETELRRKLTEKLFNNTGEKLVTAAREAECGARFTGAGGGGCLWAIGKAENISRLRKKWESILTPVDNAYMLNTEIDYTGVTARAEAGNRGSVMDRNI